MLGDFDGASGEPAPGQHDRTGDEEAASTHERGRYLFHRDLDGEIGRAPKHVHQREAQGYAKPMLFLGGCHGNSLTISDSRQLTLDSKCLLLAMAAAKLLLDCVSWRTYAFGHRNHHCSIWSPRTGVASQAAVAGARTLPRSRLRNGGRS